MKALDEAEFTIVGAGLMGSSLALSLRDKVKVIHGIDPDSQTRETARFFFDTITEDFYHATDTDVLVLAAPIRAILKILDQIAMGKIALRPGALILDLGSTKTQIVAAMDRLPEDLHAIGGHPMCGKELSGPGAAEAALYRACTFVLCPTARTTPEALTLAESMIRAIGARSLRVDPVTHDQTVAMISHLPYLVSAALVGAVGRDETRWALASTGYRDTSRLAGSDVTMMGDTLITNREAVIAAIDAFQRMLGALREQLGSLSPDAIRDTLEAIRQMRLDWFDAFQKR